MELSVIALPVIVFVYSLQSVAISFIQYNETLKNLNYNSKTYDCENVREILLTGAPPRFVSTGDTTRECLLPNTYVHRDRDMGLLEDLFDEALNECLEEGC